jgi:hypothetical protein
MITEYRLEHRRYDQPEYEPFWAGRHDARPAAEPTRGDATAGQDRGAGGKTLRDASSRARRSI